MPGKEKTQKVIIPKGSVDPTDTTVIEIPMKLRGQSVVIAKKKDSGGKSFLTDRDVVNVLNASVSTSTRSKEKVQKGEQTSKTFVDFPQSRSYLVPTASQNSIPDLDETEQSERLFILSQLEEYQQARRKFLMDTSNVAKPRLNMSYQTESNVSMLTPQVSGMNPCCKVQDEQPGSYATFVDEMRFPNSTINEEPVKTKSSTKHTIFARDAVDTATSTTELDKSLACLDHPKEMHISILKHSIEEMPNRQIPPVELPQDSSVDFVHPRLLVRKDSFDMFQSTQHKRNKDHVQLSEPPAKEIISQDPIETRKPGLQHFQIKDNGFTDIRMNVSMSNSYSNDQLSPLDSSNTLPEDSVCRCSRIGSSPQMQSKSMMSPEELFQIKEQFLQTRNRLQKAISLAKTTMRASKTSFLDAMPCGPNCGQLQNNRHIPVLANDMVNDVKYVARDTRKPDAVCRAPVEELGCGRLSCTSTKVDTNKNQTQDILPEKVEKVITVNNCETSRSTTPIQPCMSKRSIDSTNRKKNSKVRICTDDVTLGNKTSKTIDLGLEFKNKADTLKDTLLQLSLTGCNPLLPLTASFNVQDISSPKHSTLIKNPSKSRISAEYSLKIPNFSPVAPPATENSVQHHLKHKPSTSSTRCTQENNSDQSYPSSKSSRGKRESTSEVTPKSSCSANSSKLYHNKSPNAVSKQQTSSSGCTNSPQTASNISTCTSNGLDVTNSKTICGQSQTAMTSSYKNQNFANKSYSERDISKRCSEMIDSSVSTEKTYTETRKKSC